jgi:quercetin dioxygenase-like cupin family protein
VEVRVTSEHESTYARTHELTGDVLAFVLGPEIEAVLAHALAGSSGRAAKTLVKEGPLSVTLAGVRAGVQLDEHSASGPVVLQGLRGIARVTAKGNEVEVGPGTLVALDHGVAHAVQAVEDCVLLLIVTAQEAN